MVTLVAKTEYSNEHFKRLMQKLAHDEKSNEAFAGRIGVSRQTLGFWIHEDEKVRRSPKLEMLMQVSDKLNMSIDYLAGISPSNSLDADIQGVCRVTGLTEESIKAINEPQVTNGAYIINRLVESGRYKELNNYYRQFLGVALSAQDVILPDVMIDGETYSMTKNDFLDTCSQKIGNVFAEQVKEILIEYAEIEPDKRAFLAGENFIRGLGKTAEQIKQMNAENPKEFNEKLNNAIRGKNNG